MLAESGNLCIGVGSNLEDLDSIWDQIEILAESGTPSDSDGSNLQTEDLTQGLGGSSVSVGEAPELCEETKFPVTSQPMKLN